MPYPLAAYPAIMQQSSLNFTVIRCFALLFFSKMVQSYTAHIGNM